MSRQPKLLLVEDDPMIAMMVADMCDALGYGEPQVADSMEGALSAVAENDFAAVLLDVHLGSVFAWPIADILADRGIAFAFMTGGGGEVPDRHAARLTLAKPFRVTDLDSALGQLLAVAKN